MNIKETISIVAFCMAATVAIAQNNAEIAVSYTTNEPNLRTGEIDVHHKYILLANATESKFYSPKTEYIDSLRSTPEGEAKYKEMSRSAFTGGRMNKMPSRDGNYYVVKNAVDNKMKSYDINGIEKYFTEEALPEFDWQISDSTKNILGYECIMAEADYHGRKWTAWFTADIPVMNGPWKLGGLPGIILEAADNSGLYSFIADGLQRTAQPILPVYSSESYDRIDRIDFLKAKRQFIDNPISQMNAQLNGSGISIGGLGNEIRYKSREEIDFIETDY